LKKKSIEKIWVGRVSQKGDWIRVEHLPLKMEVRAAERVRERRGDDLGPRSSPAMGYMKGGGYRVCKLKANKLMAMHSQYSM